MIPVLPGRTTRRNLEDAWHLRTRAVQELLALFKASGVVVLNEDNTWSRPEDVDVRSA